MTHDESVPQRPIGRRGFVAAATAVTLGVRDAVAAPAPGEPRAGQPPRPGFVPWLEIDRAALQHNASTLRRLAGNRPLIAVVKNNCYGLGFEVGAPIIDALADVTHLAVVRADEAFALRKAGVRKPVLLMGPATPEELLELVPLDVVQSPYMDLAPDRLARVAERVGRPVRVHLYLDTGMHRMGHSMQGVLDWLGAMGAARGLRIEGAFTELTEDADYDRAQVARLRELQAGARARGIEIPMLHAASSDAVLHQVTETFLDAVRPGLAIYGGYVSERAMQRGGLRPAYRLVAPVIRIDHLAAGDGVSYHRRYTADRPMYTATLALGHVDGYPAGAVKGGQAFAKGRLYPVIGTVSASHTMIALGDDAQLAVGDPVTLVGPDDPGLHPNEVAKRAGWSEYNMFMHLSPTLAKRVV